MEGGRDTELRSPRTRLANSIARPSYNEDDFSDFDSPTEEHAVMKVGKDYQARIPDYQRDTYDSTHEALLVWRPYIEKLSHEQVDEFVRVAKEQHKYSEEQALGMLFWHKHDVERALTDLGNFAPFPDEWTVEEKVLFEQAFSYHGKSFHRIKEMLPEKSVAALVKYYYGWKKTRSKKSVMDKTKNSNSQENSDMSDSDVDGEDTKPDGPVCTNCKTWKQHLQTTRKGQLCTTCVQYWKRTGLMRPFAPVRSNANDSALNPQRYNPTKNRKRPPKGMYMDEDDLRMLANTGTEQKDAILDSITNELRGLKAQVQTNKQHISMLKDSMLSSIKEYKIADSESDTSGRWSQEDLLIAVQGVRKFGKDFKAISEVLGNKTPNQVRNFFLSYRRRYNLDAALADYNEAAGVQQSFDNDDPEADDAIEANSESLTVPPLLKRPASPSAKRASPKPKMANNGKPQLGLKTK